MDDRETQKLIHISHINTGKRTEWSPIQSVIIRMITKSQESHSLIMSMITDRHRMTRSPLKDYNFQEAQEIKIHLGNNHVGILGTRSLTTLKIIS